MGRTKELLEFEGFLDSVVAGEVNPVAGFNVNGGVDYREHDQERVNNHKKHYYKTFRL